MGAVPESINAGNNGMPGFAEFNIILKVFLIL